MSASPSGSPKPVHLERAFDHPDFVAELLARSGPYWSVQRYFANAAEHKAVTGQTTSQDEIPVVPWFRGDWAYDRALVDGVGPLLQNPHFCDAAREVFGGGIVRPQMLYVNIMFPMPRLDPGHTDVAAFRGFDRTRWPIWLLISMARSGLFERWRIRIATAVAFFYEGEAGELCYWPDGPQSESHLCPAKSNTALVGDNDCMYHRVETVGDRSKPMLKGLTLEAKLHWSPSNNRWQVFEGENLVGEESPESVRISVSWKAQVFADDAELRLYEQGEDPLTADMVVERFGADLDQRHWSDQGAEQVIDSPAFVEAVGSAYARVPS
ncbi:MAG: hypothetical protein ACI8TX_000351 [Hyphomicrobiaceae bacterium]|jgi:hypothetical protein